MRRGRFSSAESDPDLPIASSESEKEN
jgi:hypothetical protein